MKVCPKYGGQKIKARRIYRTEVLTESNDTWLEDRTVYETETPFDPYQYICYGIKYDNLDNVLTLMSKDIYDYLT